MQGIGWQSYIWRRNLADFALLPYDYYNNTPLKIKVRKWPVFEAQNLNYEKDKLDKPEKEVNK